MAGCIHWDRLVSSNKFNGDKVANRFSMFSGAYNGGSPVLAKYVERLMAAE